MNFKMKNEMSNNIFLSGGKMADDRKTNNNFHKTTDLFGETKIVFKQGKRKKVNALFEYDDFIDKFKDKKTTDDCYTPKNVYEIILDYLKSKGKINVFEEIIRPFFPNNDYKEVEYKKGSIVIDNPPFSIFTEIVRFYTKKEIPFFLFAPHMTVFSHKVKEVNIIVVGANIIYENGAKVPTSFVSNLFGDIRVFSDFNLYQKLEALNKSSVSLPKYEYPQEVLTVSDLTYMLQKGIEFEVRKTDSIYVSKIDDQKKYGKGIFGGGLLINKDKAKEKAKAKENKIVFKLSKREDELLDKIKAREEKNIITVDTHEPSIKTGT